MPHETMLHRALGLLLGIGLCTGAGGCSDNGGIDLPPGMPQAPCVCDRQDAGTASCRAAYRNPQICPDLSPVQFCSRDVGTVVSTDIILSSHGLAGLVISDIALVGDDNCAFEPPLLSPRVGMVIPYMSQEIVHLVYHPTHLGADYAVLRVQSNAENFKTLEVPVCGQGIMKGAHGDADGGMCLSCMEPRSQQPACAGPAAGPDGGM